MRQDESAEPALTAFSLYLRTGRRIDPQAIEVKYNPWHDEGDGRFTFVGQGRYYGEGGRFAGGGSMGGGGASGTWSSPSPTLRPARGSAHSRSSPRNPVNYGIHIVRPGDSLACIAALRKGLTARDLAWLNDQPIDQLLRVGQRIKLPHQAYLDAGKEAKNKFLALNYYRDTHGGKLPPDVAHPPSLESQILHAPRRKESKNGYDFHIDPIARTEKVHGELSNGPMAPRSRGNQAQAGKPDRRDGRDDGGHFIAARFNGPSDSFNHFAQDRNFNRGAYRKMEDGWAAELRGGHKVVVDIIPIYQGASKRPSSLIVKWSVDGNETIRNFPNEAKGKTNEQR